VPAANNILFIVDWRDAAQDDAEAQAQRRKKTSEEFYQLLKENAKDGFESRDIEPNVGCTFDEYVPEATNDSLCAVVSDIKLNKYKRMELYGILGIELAKRKYIHMTDKCSKCILSTDMYDIINCMKCTKVNNIKLYFEDVTKITGYSKDYINFFIHLGKLCKLYPKLLYATVSTNDLKKHMVHVVEKIKEDLDFWRIEQ